MDTPDTCVLGFDASCGGAKMRGLPTGNLGASAIVDISIYKERAGMMLFFTFTNVLNHFQPRNPSFSLISPTTSARSPINPTRRGIRSSGREYF